MKKRIIIGAFAVLAAIGLVFAFSGCDLFATVVSGESQPYGVVLNAKTGAPVEAAKVTLTPVATEVPVGASEEQVEQAEKAQEDLAEQQAESPESFYAITVSTGEFDWYSEEKTVPMGEYRLTVEVDGYISIPKTVQVNAVYPNFGEIPVLPYNADTDSGNVSFVLMWSDSFADVDGHLTYPDSLNAGTDPTTYSPYDNNGDTTTGFYPTTQSTAAEGSTDYARNRIFWGDATSASGDSYSGGITYATTYDFDYNLDGTNDTWSVSLDVDDRDGAGPETITVRNIPGLNSDWTYAGWVQDYAGDADPDFSGVASEGYDYVGVMEYYVRAYNYATGDVAADIEDSYLSEVSDGQSADAVLYVFLGDQIMGAYTIPTYTQIKNASVVRINTFLVDTGLSYYIPEYIIYPDIRVADYATEFRGLNDIPVNEVIRFRATR